MAGKSGKFNFKAANRDFVVVTGVEEIDRKLKALVPKLRKKVIRQAMTKGMRLVTKAAKLNAPTYTGRPNERVEPGKLRKAIKTLSSRSAAKKGKIRVMTQVSGKPFKGEPFYPAFVEYGHKGAPPHPYMAPAFDSAKDAARKVAMDAILEGVEREITSST